MGQDYLSFFLEKDEDNKVFVSVGYWGNFWSVPHKWRGNPRKAWRQATIFLMANGCIGERDLEEVKKWRTMKKEKAEVLI